MLAKYSYYQENTRWVFLRIELVVSFLSDHVLLSVCEYACMGNSIIGALCQKPTIMSEDGFNRNKTLKVSGVSKLLQDQLTKEFQRKGNSTRFHDDVNRLYVCPQGHDYVLVEFVKDLPSGNLERLH